MKKKTRMGGTYFRGQINLDPNRWLSLQSLENSLIPSTVGGKGRCPLC